MSAPTFEVGDRVAFDPRGAPLLGTVTRVFSPDFVEVQVDGDPVRWRLRAVHLRRVAC